MIEPDLSDDDYRALADFRQALRQFMSFSERAAEATCLTPQQHQALLAIRAEGGLTVGDLAGRLLLRSHSASGLADRLVRLDLVERRVSTIDRRRVELILTKSGQAVLTSLSSIHRNELRRLRPLLTGLLARL